MARYITTAEHLGKPTLSSCTVERKNGSFCDAPSAPDMPFPICQRHSLRIFRWMYEEWQTKACSFRDIYEQERQAELAFVQAQARRQAEDERLARRSTAAALQDSGEFDEGEVVYYLRIGNLIKIGTTVDIIRRLKQYPPNVKLLGTEPGDARIERVRLEQFQHLLSSGREWFTPAPDLVQHIKALRKLSKAAKQAA